ncbi:transcription antitermination factor NusB [Halothermothrix orenii]|uniref:Transcription antitermination protein NusB n=1 Tax=Halothermothrix orenii (strain H 168 / OCM 544 / DSM 9562) TaxID=373903 RepID=NUSB_HALOH|nr:transcription antitermination factor NusB [Halothermothrix orenii]B8D2G0.1 RecName: Full=Transcription antitermination protein NusB; AltName: Full=Antitermination factor NusB [Halothermothrix orenii H 168]ACL69387.1 NusB antitermination factor [Halothermothrix orenii H 168]
MKITRHQERVWALQILYSLDISSELNIQKARKTCREFKYKKVLDKKRYYFEDIVEGVINSRQDLDSIINKYAIDWDVERMACIDRNILRIALYEIESGLPVGVAIDEAVEIAKDFGDSNSPKFINGILAKSIED